MGKGSVGVRFIVGLCEGDHDGLDGRAHGEGYGEVVADALALGKGVDVGIAFVQGVCPSSADFIEGERDIGSR